jgi:CRP-like cAMP-binding protein
MRTTTLERPALLKALAAHPFLEGVDERLLMLLLAGAESFRFRNGERLAKMGRPANDFFLIQTGQVAVLAAGDDGREVCRIGAGEVLGWSWMVPPYLGSSTARLSDKRPAFASTPIG